jgi:hypothetical protein
MNSQDPASSLAMKATTAEGSWARRCAGLGAVIWAGVAVLARIGLAPIGAIELMFLFAPLVIVPLGIELGRVMGSDTPLTRFARRIQPAAAALAVAALWLPPGRLAGGLACVWMVACLSMTIAAIIDLSSLAKSRPDSSTRSTMQRITVAVAQLDLSVGGAWLVASRLGLRPMGIQEPIGLLTAVHFHYAGFATAMIAAAMLQFAAQRHEYWLRWLVAVVIGMPFVVAAGFVISPQLKLGAAALFSASVASLAVVLRSCAKRLESGTARVLFHVASVSVFAGMVLSIAYAVADFRGSDVLPIPQMARTHGILNAVGFCLPGLLGWLVENDSALQ